VGLDLGGTTITGLLVDDGGRVIARRHRPTPVPGAPEPGLEAMRAMAAELMTAAPDAARMAGLGIGVAGPVDSERGVSLFSPNLGWRDVEVGSFFERAFGLPVRVDNDVRVAALGEGWVGAARPYRSFIVITVGTGIGSGVVLDGRLWGGPGFSAGETGHIPLRPDPDAPLCGCGRRGCLEALASGRAIARDAMLAIERGEETALAAALREKDRLSARDVAEAARVGDAVARRIFEEAADHLARGVVTVVDLFNPEAVVIGGGVAGAWDLLFPILEREVKERAYPPSLRSLEGIFPAALGEDAGAVGAAGLILTPEPAQLPPGPAGATGNGASGNDTSGDERA
jgi:glucokinase